MATENNLTLKLKRNGTAFGDKSSALSALEAQMRNAAYGEVRIASYSVEGGINKSLLLAIKGEDNTYQIFEGASLNNNKLDIPDEIKKKIEEIKDGTGGGSADDILNDLNLSPVGGNGKVITKISQVNGKVSAEAIDLTVSQIVNDSEEVEGTTLKDVLEKIANDITPNTIYGENAIQVNGSSDENTTISLKINDSDKILSQSGDGLLSNLSVTCETEGLGANIREQYQLIGKNNEKIGEPIKIYKDTSLKEVELVEENEEGQPGQYLKFTYLINNGEDEDDVVYVDVSLLLSQSEFKDGLQVSESGEVSVKIDDESYSDLLTVSEDGIRLNEINTTDINFTPMTGGSDPLESTNLQDVINELHGKIVENKTSLSTDFSAIRKVLGITEDYEMEMEDTTYLTDTEDFSSALKLLDSEINSISNIDVIDCGLY